MFASPLVDNPTTTQIVSEALMPCVSEDMNTLLTADPSPQEIKDALFNIHPGKAPGPDGFSLGFFSSKLGCSGTCYN